MEIENLQKKLKLNQVKKALVLNLPKDFEELYTGLSIQENFESNTFAEIEFVQVYALSQGKLEKDLLSFKGFHLNSIIFWISYPKLTGSIRTDMKRETIWHAFSLIGLEAISQISMDTTWTALRAKPIVNNF